ncbi:MAG TPA: UDP-glucose 4-epimerase GalE [Defluviicoccus sp.]|nr:UDP-glucose 4-epimerase GalE [Defluviicoccus sp.]
MTTTAPQRVLVTGGAGYVGSHACKALAQAGYLPVTYDNLSTGNRWAVRWGPLELGDILDPERLQEVFQQYRPVAVMHFAALALVGESMQAPALYYRNNTVGALNVADAAVAHSARAFVFSSTCATYGEPAEVPIPETTPQHPVNPYGASKLMIERVLADYEMAYGLPHACLRYFNAAGADPETEIGECRVVETHLIPLVLDAILGTRPPLKIFGTDYPTPDGSAVRDYIHVADLADAHVAALKHLIAGKGSLKLNLGTGRGYSVREVVACAEAVTGRKVPLSYAPRRPGDPPALVAAPGRSVEVLGLAFRHSSSLEAVIETAWRWHEHLHATQRAAATS